MPSIARLHWIAGALLALLLVGCPGPAQPTATPASPTPAPPTQAPATPTPDGAPSMAWVEQQTDLLTIRLPSDWKVIDVGAGDAQAIFDELKASDPDLAAIVGSAEAFQGTVFWAFRDVDASFAENVNIRRTPLEGERIEDMQAVIDAVVAQYQEVGFQVTASDAKLSIGGQPAGHIAFSFELNAASDQPTSIHGRQYVVATDTDLWILSYSASLDSITALAPVFEQSALSFRVK